MCSKHLLFITLQEINAFPPVLPPNLIKSFKTKNEQHVLGQDQSAANTYKNSKTSFFFMEPTLTKCGLCNISTMGSFPLMENLALMMPFCHWLSLDSLAFKSLPNELFPFTRISQPVVKAPIGPCFTHSRQRQVLSIYRVLLRKLVSHKVPIMFKMTFLLGL